MRWSLIALLLACNEPASIYVPVPAPELSRTFPLGATSGCWTCGGVTIVGHEEPTELERDGVPLRFSVGGGRVVMASVDGCSFFVDPRTFPNPNAWGLSYTTCGSSRGRTRYTDSFLIINPWEYTWEPADPDARPQQLTSYSLLVQLNGRRGSVRPEPITHTYDCERTFCP